MENLTGGTPPVRYLPCVVPCKLYFAEHEKLQATVKLLAELAKGVESIRTEGLLTIDEAFAGLDEEKQDPKEA